MITAKKVYRKLSRLPLFTLLDDVQGRSINLADTIFINGFWRSGTTYFMEYLEKLLRRRKFFEPMHYSVEQSRPLHTLMGFTIKGNEMTQCHPFILPQAKKSDHDAFYEAMLCGRQVSTPWTRRNRRISLSLKKNIIIKSVRSNLVAPYLMNRFGVKNIFIIRHPAGVLASIIRKEAGTKSIYESLSSEICINVLLQQIKNGDPKLLNDNLLAAIKKYRGDKVNNIILSWCLCNYVPLKYINKGLYHPLLINYESFFMNNEVKEKLYDYLTLDDRINILNFDSSTTTDERKNTSTYNRLYSWQKDLKTEQINKVYDICSYFGEEIEKIINTAESYNTEPNRV